MTTYNTGNPIGSTDARDRSDNSANLDLAVNSLSQTFVDRFGVTRDTLEGIYKKSAYYRAGTFDAGYTLTNNRQTLAYGNVEYSWSGSFPKVVAAGSTPETTGGIGAGAWVDRTQEVLRSEIISGYLLEASMISTSQGSNMDSEILNINSHIKPISSTPNAIFLSSLIADKSLATRVNIIPVADSFGDGIGASLYNNRYLKLFEGALNHSNIGGFGYATDTRLTDVVNVTGSGVATNGTITTSGALQSQLRLTSGQYVSVTNKQISFADLFYEGGTTTGDVVVQLNGVTFRTIVTTKTAGIKNSFTAPEFSKTKKSDVITFIASGGTVDITGLITLRGPTSGPLMLKVSHGGWSYKTYDDNNIASEIAAYGNFASPGYTVYMLLLGTNSIYNASESQSPGDMITSMTGLIAKLTAATPNVGFIIGVPPKTNETLWPVIQSGFTHADYVTAITDFCSSNGVQCIRFDDIDLAGLNLLSDGVHPNDYGHALYFRKLAESLGIPAVSYVDDMQKDEPSSGGVTFNSTWGTFLNDNGSIPRWHRVGNVAYLSGAVQPNGSTSTTMFTIPAEIRPLLRNVNCMGFNNTGAAQVSVLSNGNVAVVSVPSLYMSFEISWVIDNKS